MFSKANAKIRQLYNVSALSHYLNNNRKVYSFDILSGWSCPFAHDCLSKVVLSESGKRTIADGKHTQFRCFSASQEALLPSTYNLRKRNYDALRGKTLNQMVNIIESAMPHNAGIMRWHVSGDMFSETYFRAWLAVAQNNSDRLFYAYTKSLKYWINNLQWVNRLDNVSLTASYGGRLDYLIDQYSLKYSKVVYSVDEADQLGLPVDHDDSHAAIKNDQPFALLIHGTQPAGSKAGKAVKALNGHGSYSR